MYEWNSKLLGALLFKALLLNLLQADNHNPNQFTSIGITPQYRSHNIKSMRGYENAKVKCFSLIFCLEILVQTLCRARGMFCFVEHPALRTLCTIGQFTLIPSGCRMVLQSVNRLGSTCLTGIVKEWLTVR